MRIKSVLFVIVFCISFKMLSQANLNDYKYVIVPEQFSAFEEPNKYRLNELAEFLYNKYGFFTLMENEEFPEDLINERCLGLRANVYKEKGFLKIKLKSDLRNCNGTIVYSAIGETREKDFKKGYQLALRDAFTSFEGINYKYTPKERQVSNTNETIVTQNSEEVKRLQEEVKALQAEKEKQIKAVEDTKIAKEKEALENIAVKTQKVITANSNIDINPSKVLYAQPIENGFQLVDSTPKVVMILLETGRKDTFIVKDKNASVYKEDGFWYISKTDGDKVTTEVINIKFF